MKDKLTTFSVTSKFFLTLFIWPQIGTIEKRRLSKFDSIKSIQMCFKLPIFIMKTGSSQIGLYFKNQYYHLLRVNRLL